MTKNAEPTSPIETPRRSRRRTAGIAALATATAVAAGALTTYATTHHETGAKKSSAEIILDDANRVAFRYNGKVVSFTDQHSKSGHHQGQLPRQTQTTVVHVKVDLNTKPETQDALHRYANSPAVQWGAPQIGADIETDGRPYGLMVGSKTGPVAKNPETGEEIVEADLYLDTDVPNGTKADLYIENDVFALPNGLTEQGTNITGVTTFAVATYDSAAGIWNFSPNELPTIPTHVHQPGQ